MGGPGLAYPTPAHILTPGSAASASQHIWYEQRGQVPEAASLLLLKVRSAQSIFLWYDHLATARVPSIGLKEVIAHTEGLTEFT